jgi:hypothetical protein
VRQVQPLADLAVREPGGGEPGDLQLLRRQRRRADMLARRRQKAAVSARDRILTTADRLFCSHGIQAVGVQRVVEESQVTETLLHETGHPDPVVAARTLLALRTGYVFSAGLEEDAGWAEEFVAAYDRVVDAR